MDVFIVLIKDNDTIVAKCMSNTSENADKIASLFGGGGHKKEAGFTVSNIEISTIIDKVKTYLKSNNLKRKI
jgi:nanoRNase/pAp phosphatase (c-di-AMP/oligoRNAs hydrolase)